MKYWFLTTAYTTDQNNEIGYYVKEHTRIYAEKGHELLIIHDGEATVGQETNDSTNIKLHAFSLTGKASTLFMGHEAALSFEFANEVIKLLAADTPDVIEVQNYQGIGYYLLIRKYAGEPLLKNIPVIVTVHMPSFLINELNHTPAYRFPQYWTGEMEKFSMLAADLLISPGRNLLETIKAHMPEAFPSQAHHLPYPVQLDNYYNAKNALVTRLIQSPAAKKSFPVLRPQPKHTTTSQPLLADGLTVSIPYYNMGEFIEACIESILASTFKNIKIILVDDGSTEAASVARLNDIQQKYPAITIIRQNNAGLSEARNTGLRMADTKYIMFLDADDTVQEDYFNQCIHILDQYDNISFVSCWLNYFGAEEGIWPGQNPEVPYLLFHNTVHSGCVFKTDDILQTGGYDRSLIYGMEDYEIAVHMVSKGFHGVTIPAALYNYRIRQQSMARGFTEDRKLYLYTLIANKHKALFDRYGAEIVNILNANGPGYLHDNPTFASRFAIKANTPPGIRSIRSTLSEVIYNKYPKLHKLVVTVKKIMKGKH